MKNIRFLSSALIVLMFGVIIFILPAAAEPPKEAAKEITIDIGGVPLEMVRISAGTFQMGVPSAEAYSIFDGQIHKVTITKDFYIGKYEVTQKQWEKVIAENPCNFKNGENYPIESVSWEAICKKDGFLDKLNALTGKAFRLPTEAEWEYAARGGTQTSFFWSDDPSFKLLDEYAWHKGNSDKMTHPVGQKKPNAYGLYDTSGNVTEWCSDWCGNYPKDAVIDPAGPATGDQRIARGGSWYNEAQVCRVAERSAYYPEFSSFITGFRLVLPAAQ